MALSTQTRRRRLRPNILQSAYLFARTHTNARLQTYTMGTGDKLDMKKGTAHGIIPRLIKSLFGYAEAASKVFDIDVKVGELPGHAGDPGGECDVGVDRMRSCLVMKRRRVRMVWRKGSPARQAGAPCLLPILSGRLLPCCGLDPNLHVCVFLCDM